MKIASFTLDGRAAYGVVDGQRTLLPPAAFRARHPDLLSVLDAGALPELAFPHDGEILAAWRAGRALSAGG